MEEGDVREIVGVFVCLFVFVFVVVLCVVRVINGRRWKLKRFE